MANEILFNEEARKSLQDGVNKVANAVGSTMGAAGKTVIIGRPGTLGADVTKDGVTVASSIELKDKVENIGAMMIRKASEKTYFDAGDGTTQTAVLAQIMINMGLKNISAGSNPIEVKRGVEKAVSMLVKSLKEKAIAVGDNIEKIKQIATTSANNDKVIGDLFGEAYSKIGKDGLLILERVNLLDSTVEIVEGYEMPRGYISTDFATDSKKRAVHHNALVLVADYHIRTMKEIFPLLDEMTKNNLLTHPLIIIAQDYDGEFFSSMMRNHLQGQLRCCLVKAPAQYRKEHMEDIATIVGATVIRDENGLKLTNARVKHLGSAEKIIISEQTTTVMGGGGKPEKIESLKEAVKLQMEEAKDEQLKKDWERRLAKISGTIAVMKVGGATDVDQGERFARVDDAFRSVRSAIDDGVIVGGGVALLRLCQGLKEEDFVGDEKVGMAIVKTACYEPIKRMLTNAGLDPNISATVLQNSNFNIGYNINTRTVEDLYETGVIDPVKVIICALQNSSSVAGAIMSSECLIVYSE